MGDERGHELSGRGPLTSLEWYGRPAASVFDLLGRGEVHLTSALGWTLSESPLLLARIWRRLGMPGDPAQVGVALEVQRSGEGRTDLELVGDEASVVVEAKKGWLLPGVDQLAGYVPRLDASHTRLLVSLSDSSAAWASYQLPEHVDGVPVVHLPWDALREDIRSARTSTRSAGERLWLDQLATYLSGATSVRDQDTQWVFNVVVSDGVYAGRSFREWVQSERLYFHPFGVGKGWPKLPPVFLGFRWGGRVRQVNRVLSTEVYSSLHQRFPDAPLDEDPHIVYQLGPDLPVPDLLTRGTYATGRVWALLDQMMVRPTLQEAVLASREIAGTPGD